MPNESLLDALAQRTAADIVDRHAGDCRALIDAIARIVRCGLEASVLLWKQNCDRPETEHT